MFHLPRPALFQSQIRLQRPPEQLLQHRPAHPTDPRIIPPLAQLVADKRMLRPRRLVERKLRPARRQRRPDRIPPRRRHVRVLLAEDQHQLRVPQRALARQRQRVLRHRRVRVRRRIRAQARAVDVRREVAHGGRDAWVRGAPVREVPAQAHSCRPDHAGACGQGEKVRYAQGGVFVV